MELTGAYERTASAQPPQCWETVPLRDHLVQDATYGVVKAGRFQRAGVPMVRGGDIRDGLISDDQPFITPEKSREYSRTELKERDVLIALVGYPGESAVVPRRLSGANISRAVGLLRPAASLLPEFLACYLNSPAGRAEFLRPSAGSAQIVVNLGALNRLRIPLPPISEQERIATAIDDTSALLDGLTLLIAKKRDLKQAAMQHLLTGRTRLPGFHAKWQLKPLGDVADMGSGGTPSSLVPAYFGGDIPWVSISDMTSAGKFIDHTERTLTKLGFDSCSARMFRGGTVLYAMYASLGECSIATTTLCSSQAILGISPRSDLDGEFLYYYLQSIKPGVKLLGQHGTQANLNKEMVQEFQLLVPTRDEQTAIATVLADMDAELAVLEARHAKTHALKQAMMQELLTGRIRLVSPEPAHA